ncbi:AaceriABR021Wp [[Ashbya] aceris (nom. inval.)]|nr:AaceriABR021Wp [[Ashbya] aceris (nom. inval.)]
MRPDISKPVAIGKPLQINTDFSAPNTPSSGSSDASQSRHDGAVVSRGAIIERIRQQRGTFCGEVQWCSNLSLDDWRTHFLEITERGVLTHALDRDSVANLQSTVQRQESLMGRAPQAPAMAAQNSRAPIIKHLQACSLRLLNNHQGPFPILEVGTYHNKIYLRIREQRTFLDMFSALLFWKSLQSTGVFNKFSVVAPIFKSVPEPTNLLVCQFKIYGPLPRNKHVPLLSMKRPPLPDNVTHSPEEGWFAAMGMLGSDGVLDLLLQSDGSLLYSIDIKKLLRSEIQIMDSSILQKDTFMFIGILPELRKQLGISSKDSMFTSRMRAGTLPRLFLQFPLRIDLEDWYVALHSFAMLEVLSLIGTDKSNELRVSNRFKVTILEADLRMLEMERKRKRSIEEHNESEQTESDAYSFYATVSIWNQQVARTSIVSGKYTPFWREEFDFNFSVKANNMRVSIRESAGDNAAYSDNDTLLGYIEISQDMINDTELNKETRLPIFAVDNKSFQLGTICIKLASSLNFVLPSINFSKFESVLKEFDLQVMTNYVYDTAIADDLKLDGISNVFLDVFQAIGRENDWFQALIEKELAKFDKSILTNSQNSAPSTHIYNSLFRGNSILSKSIEKYFNRIGQEYLDKSIGGIIRRIVDEEEMCELDPARIKEPYEAKKRVILETNQAKLVSWAKEIWHIIYKTSNDLPDAIKVQLTHIRKKLEIVCGDSNLKTVLNCISGFLFLRFFCPVLLNPKLFHIVEDHPDEQQRRLFTLLTKVLMNLSTLTMFGPKEPWMNNMNHFIQEHKEELVDYIDKVTQRKLDFNNKILKLSNTVARPKLDMNKEILRELATNPYLIERYLRETELVNAFVTYRNKLTSLNRLDLKPVTMDQISRELQTLPISPTDTPNLRIGELEFEKITENNVEVFGQDMLKYLDHDDASIKKQGTRALTPEDSADLTMRLEQESDLLFHKIKHLTTVLSDYEYPSDIILGKSEYATFLVESVYYDSQRSLSLDCDNMFAKRDGFTKLFQNAQTVNAFFSPVKDTESLNAFIKSIESTTPVEDSQENKNMKGKLTRNSPARTTKLSRWFKKVSF